MITHPYRSVAQAFSIPDPRYDTAFLLGLFRSMLRIRRIEEEIERQYHLDQMKTPIHLVIGQEATSVGCCAALGHADLLFSSHRTHGNYLAKGGDLKAMLSEMFCRANGCAGSRGGSMHLIDKRVGMAGTSAIVGGAVPVATGAALGRRFAASATRPSCSSVTPRRRRASPRSPSTSPR
jgi:pyruvate dehydrogenase E1 component alpha subunit